MPQKSPNTNMQLQEEETNVQRWGTPSSKGGHGGEHWGEVADMGLRW